MINGEEEYRGLLSGILHGGIDGDSRAGKTRSVFGRQLRHDMASGFPLLTTKKVYFKNAVTELLWILQGRTDLAYLHEHGLKYWDADYKRSGRTDGSLGPVYGHQLRNFNGKDQLAEVLKLIEREPTSRRIMASLWNPTDMDDMVLPPCHYGFQVSVKNGTLDLMWNQRSCDMFLGVPYDLAMYGLLLLMFAKRFDLKPGQLIGNFGDCHIYHNHFDAVRTQLERKMKPLPTVQLLEGLIYNWNDGNIFVPGHNEIKLLNYDPHGPIKAPLSVGS